MPPDLALSATLIGSNYPCLELIFMVPKVFEPLKFDCNMQFYRRDCTSAKKTLAYTKAQYSRTFVARTLMARLPRLFRTRS